MMVLAERRSSKRGAYAHRSKATNPVGGDNPPLSRPLGHQRGCLRCIVDGYATSPM